MNHITAVRWLSEKSVAFSTYYRILHSSIVVLAISLPSYYVNRMTSQLEVFYPDLTIHFLGRYMSHLWKVIPS